MAQFDDLDWWTAKTHERGHVLTSIVNTLQDRQGYRREADLHHLRLFADRTVSQSRRGAFGFEQRVSGTSGRRPRLSINVVRSCIDTAVSQITRSRPRPQFMTTGGNWDLHQRAKKAGKFVEGIFHRAEAYALGQRAFRDACIFGSGFLHVHTEHDRINIERVPPNEMLIDDAEGVYGAPKNVFRVRIMDKLVLKELFPGKSRLIEDAPPPEVRYYGRSSASRLTAVAQAWHLKSGPDAKDGRYAVTLLQKDGLLYSGDYTHEEAPFAKFTWAEDPFGYFGTGLGSELSGIQHEINQLLLTIQANIYMGGNLKVFVPKGSIAKGQISNSLRSVIVETNGDVSPTYVVNDVASPQLFQHLFWLVEQAYGVTGISQAMAQSATPDRAESGRAKLVQRQTESQRFLHVERQYENSFMALTNRVLDAAKDLAARGVDLVASYPGRWSVDRIRYEDVVLPEDDTLVQVFPTSILPQTPAGRLAMVESLEARGYIDRAQAIKLLDFPDVDSEMSLELAPLELIDMRIGKMLDDGEYQPPHPRMDLELAQSRAVLASLWAEERGAPEDRLEVLSQFIDAVQDLIAQGQPPTPVAAPVDPMAAGMPMDGMTPPAFPDQAPLPPAAPVAA